MAAQARIDGALPLALRQRARRRAAQATDLVAARTVALAAAQAALDTEAEAGARSSDQLPRLQRTLAAADAALVAYAGGATSRLAGALATLARLAALTALGTLMSVGLMVLPAATARFWVRRLTPLLGLAVSVALLACVVGLLVSYHADWPTGPVIVLSLGTAYLFSMVFGPHGLLRHQRPASLHLKA